MGDKGQYKTRQREEVLSYLRSAAGQHVTANEVCSYFKLQGRPMGTATVYRQLERMVDEGLVSKYIIDANTPACFEYTPRESHVNYGQCFHCRCEVCGTLFHIRCDELECLAGHLSAEHGFTIDPLRTVFYGVCGECRRREEAGE